MLVQESLSAETPQFKSMHYDTADDAYETLSLSDLPLYGDQSFDESEQDLSSSDDHDYFEFSSQEFSPSTATFPPENFIFCGKVIPYRNPDASEHISSKIVEISQNKQTSIKKERGGWGVFGRKLGLSRSSKKVQPNNGEKSTILTNKTDDHQWSQKKRYNSKQQVFPLHKMPMLTSTTSGKARWYMFLFGMPKLSSEMKLNDMKSRQSRSHSPPTSPTIRSFNYHDDEVTGGTNTGSGLWGLIRVLSCGGNHHRSIMIDQSRRPNRLE